MPRKTTTTDQIKKATASEKEKKKPSDTIQTDVYNIQGKVIGKTSLPKEIFRAKINQPLIAQAVRIYLANQRSGTHSTKTRSQVSGSTRKIYRQKGTGRARHGDIKAPIFIGGGIAHGPSPRDYSLSFPTKMKRLALFGAISQKYQSGEIKLVSGLESISSKTKEMVQVLSNLNLTNKDSKKSAKTLLILPGKINSIFLAGRNISYLSIIMAQFVNTYDILNHKNILLMKDSIKTLTDTFFKKTKDLNVALKDANRKKEETEVVSTFTKKETRKKEKKNLVKKTVERRKKTEITKAKKNK